MNPAIEYIVRNGRAEQYLSLPCSLFLESRSRKKGDIHGKMIVSLQSEGQQIYVRQYIPWKTNKSSFWPPYTQSVIDPKSVFTNPEVIVEGFELMNFTEDMPHSDPQVSDMPAAALQEQQYDEFRSGFYRPKNHLRRREDWLWQCFDRVFVGPEVRARYFSPAVGVQREIVAHFDHKTWIIWESWKKELLKFSGDIAPELVFAKAYKNYCPSSSNFGNLFLYH